MKINASKSILIIIVFNLLSFTVAYAQVEFNSCGINLTIPNFKSDSAFSDSQQILVRKQVLRPIHFSKSMVEIRLFSYPYFSPGRTIIIKCDGNKFQIDHFGLGFQPVTDRKNKYKHASNLGPLPENPSMDVLVFYERQLQLVDYSWQEFFKDLIDNHFFDLMSQMEIHKKILATSGGVKISGESAIYIQVKVGNNYRNMIFSGSYGLAAQEIPEVRNISNIYRILNKIK